MKIDITTTELGVLIYILENVKKCMVKTDEPDTPYTIDVDDLIVNLDTSEHRALGRIIKKL